MVASIAWLRSHLLQFSHHRLMRLSSPSCKTLALKGIPHFHCRSFCQWSQGFRLLMDIDARQMDVHCRNPNLAKCGGEAQHLEKLGIWSPPGLPNVQSSTTGPKTPCIGVFLMSLERSWSLDIENALALGIWTSVAQVLGKRRAGSQTGSLTPDH
jgi:hypothetical protein